MKKQAEVIAELKRRITGGVYVPGVRMPSEQELADELGVNRITLNKATGVLVADGWLIRGKSSRDGTYVKDRSLAAFGSLGALIQCRNSYDYELLHGMMDSAARSNFLLCVMAPDEKELPHAIRMMRASGVRGGVVAGYGQLHPDAAGLPVVFADSVPGDGREHIVVADLDHGARELVDVLRQQGKRDIVFCYYSGFGLEANARTAGFLARLRELGTPAPERRFFHVNSSHVLVLKKIFSAFPGVSAIVGENDVLAFELLQCARKHFPETVDKLTFAGFGNVREVQRLSPFLTVDQHPYEIGSRAVERLAAWVRTGSDPAGETIESLPVTLAGEVRDHGTLVHQSWECCDEAAGVK